MKEICIATSEEVLNAPALKEIFRDHCIVECEGEYFHNIQEILEHEDFQYDGIRLRMLAYETTLPKNIVQAAQMYALESISLSQVVEEIEKNVANWSIVHDRLFKAIIYAELYEAEYNRQMNLAESMYER